MPDSGLAFVFVEPWVENVLTDDERVEFERDGYLLVRGALGANTIEPLLTLAERYDAAYRAEPNVGPFHVLNLHDLVGRDGAFLELVDAAATFPKVFGVLGWNIQLFHTQLIVTPPAPPDAGAGSYGWHQDNNRMNLDFETPPPHPRVSVKIGYFLTALPEPHMGNLCVVPGSHLFGRPGPAGSLAPEHAVELTASPGDAVVFDRRLWHAASTNTSQSTRVFLTYGYAYRWLRPKSAMELSTLLGTCSEPVRRQLLGAAPTGANGYFEPQEDDVPLRTWIRDNLGGAAVAP